jgi:predicted porin
VPQGGTFEVKHLWVIADTVEYGALNLHIAYQQAAYSYDPLDALFDAFRQFGPQGTALADKHDLDDKRAQLITAGAVYDPCKWFATGEWGRRNLHSAAGASNAWYLSGGYRLAKLTPYLTYATAKAAALNALLATTGAQNTISVGSRWDVMKNVDLKLQYDHIDLGAGSAGTLINVQPGFQPGGTVNVFSITIDFVW